MPAAVTFVTSALTSIGVSAAAAATIATGIVQAAVGALVSTALTALAGKPRMPKPEELRRQLNIPTSRPPYRYVYGDYAAIGTPLPYPVQGNFAYSVYLVNSRPSEGPFTLYLDNREVLLSGDPYDMTGPGAAATNEPFLDHVRVWIGRGDQTQPPSTYISEVPYVATTQELGYRATDAGEGLTLVYVLMNAGANSKRQERWPSATPLLTLTGKFSLVWDPRDNAQSLDDPSTWRWSDNQVLCALDMYTQNPFRPYRESALLLSSWEAAADVADEVVPLKSGGSEPRYRVATTVAFGGGELEDVTQPLLAAGASMISQQGAQLGIVPAGPLTPSVEFTDTVGNLGISTLKDDSELPTSVRVLYAADARANEAAELAEWAIPGALAADGGQAKVVTYDLGAVSSATQAQRVRNITGKRARLQKQVTLEALPSQGLVAVPGSVARLTLPAPFNTLFNGDYTVTQLTPTADVVGQDGIALRVPAVLLAYDPDVYAWDEQVDEETIINPPYVGARSDTPAPGAITITTGATVNLNTGGTIIPRVRFAFDPAVLPTDDPVFPLFPQPNTNRSYEWQFKPPGEEYGQIFIIDGNIPLDSNGKVHSFMQGAADAAHDIRVRTFNGGNTSAWVEFIGATPVVDVTLAVPTNGSATAGTGEITVEFLSSNDPELTAVEIWGSDSDDVGVASLLQTINISQNTVASVTETGLTTGQQRWYFARCRGDFASASAFTASVTATAL